MKMKPSSGQSVEPRSTSTWMSSSADPAIRRRRLQVDSARHPLDVEHDSTDWPLLDFIFMVDAFTPDNGATRFIPGSHRWGHSPRDARLQEHTARVGVGMRAGRVTSRIQWVDMARPGCQRLQPATSVAAGRVHSARWSGRYRLLRTDESRDPRANWYRRASGAGAPRLVAPAHRRPVPTHDRRSQSGRCSLHDSN